MEKSEMKETGAPEDIETAILDFVRKEIYDPSMDINVDTHLIDAGLDSFSLLRILVFVEKQFGLLFPEEEINEERMRSVQNISRLVHELRERR